ncbi:MAG: translation initiation factor IF-2 [Campylobacteraceae bacterium]|nr:translation initiation factor IF-2 [Campylobacteraceae bacterium]
MSDNVRVYEIAEEAGATSAEVITKAKDLSIELKSPQSTVSFEDAEEIANYIMTGKSSKLPKKEVKKKPIIKKAVKIEEPKTEEAPVATQTVQEETVKKEEPKVEVVSDKKVEEVKTSPDKKEEPKVDQKEKTSETKVSGSSTETPVVKTTPVSADTPTSTIKKIIPKRRGLKIVKKKKPRPEVKPEIIHESYDGRQPKKQMKSLSEILGSVSSSTDTSRQDEQRRVKTQKRKTAARAHEHGKIMNVSNSSEFKTSQDSILGEEIVLLDMSTTDESKLLQEEKRPKQIRTTKPSAFGNRPQGLRRKKRKKRVRRDLEEIDITEITIPEDVRVYEFAEACGKSPSEVITVLFGLGMLVTKNDFLQQDELEILGEEFGIEVTVKDALEDVNYIEDYHEDEEHDDENLVTRPPVVTIMGHVDHGKTSLLDKIRESKVADSEAGGITQHVAAYTVIKNNEKITFVDTPGHEAFSAMRARGASVTDIIILVVAADDGVKPQTIEAIAHAKASGCPIIVAINKIDKEAANIDMVKGQMAEKEMTPVDWGGDVEFIGVSAKTGEGIDTLLENILIQSELLELKADPTVKAKTVVLESSLEKGRGPVATVIVQNGTLRVGDNIVADTTYGRIKALTNDSGKSVQELLLSETGRVLGLNVVPTTGSFLVVQDSEKEARDIATTRAEHARAKELSKSTKVTLEEMSGLIAEGKIKALPVIIKADAGGSLEAIKGSLEKIKNDEVKVKVIHAAVGGITESDLALAGASEDCIVLGFNVRPTGSVKQKAKAEGIQISTYSIIYDLIDDIKATLSGMMSAVIHEENTGQAEVRETFVVPKIGTVAGCIVSDGKVIKGGLARIIRDGVETYTGKISSLKRFKDDVKEVGNGYECGIMFEKFNDIQVGDFIETFIEIEEKVTID